MENKIADKGIKIDLHIHSIYSKDKDGQKVAENTLENLNVLIDGIVSNDVEMCAITDHDRFNYDLYSKLKEEEQKENGIKKVLPGIEFSVEFVEGTVIHIVTIFDDKDPDKIKNIDKIMNEGNGITLFKKTKGAYSKNDYFNLLAEADVDFIMIAHQKKTISSQHKAHSNDVMSLGKETFNELIFMDYFDALEFRNKKNEIYNKVYIDENHIEENIRFITGSDCHTWTCYPNTKGEKDNNFKFTYIKSLPTFKGLAMAVTDHHRIELENSFFNPNEHYMKELNLVISGTKVNIPLSRGINVIIGDNSVGKSLFLNAITNNCKNIDKRLLKGYNKYIERNEITFENVIDETDIFKFNQQGEIKDIFDEDGMKPDKYLSSYYPAEINATKYRNYVDNDLERLYEGLTNKFEYDKEVNKLPKFIIPASELIEKSITFLDTKKKINIKDIQQLSESLETIVASMEKVTESKAILDNDVKHIQSTIEMFKMMQEKYNSKLEEFRLENEKINVFNTFIKKFKSTYARRITDEQSVYSDFVEQKQNTIDMIFALLEKKENLICYQPSIEETIIKPESNSVDKYKFISKLQIEKIDNEYIEKIIDSVIRKDTRIQTDVISENELKDIIKNYPSDSELSVINVFKEKISSKVDKDFKIRNTIIEDNMDVYDEVSSGFDAQMYFTLLCGEMRDKGIYLIDQPEDHISPKAIKEKVLDQFRRMGHQRQVIMVTHNPQFIVNLDVDNVIFLSKDNGKFYIQSGALEYENEQYKILKIVADNIEGGLRTIQGRMKRYEKNI